MLERRLQDGDTVVGSSSPARHAGDARDSESGAPSRGSSTVHPRLLGIRDAALYLSVSSWTLRGLVWSGQLPEVRIGRRLLFDLGDLDHLIETSKQHRETI